MLGSLLSQEQAQRMPQLSPIFQDCIAYLSAPRDLVIKLYIHVGTEATETFAKLMK